MPGRFDEQPAGVALPAFVIEPWRRRVPEDFSLGTSPR